MLGFFYSILVQSRTKRQTQITQLKPECEGCVCLLVLLKWDRKALPCSPKDRNEILLQIIFTEGFSGLFIAAKRLKLKDGIGQIKIGKTISTNLVCQTQSHQITGSSFHLGDY